MKNKFLYLSKNVLLFSLSSFVPGIIGFILIPLYTGFLSSEEYGIADLLIATVQLLIPVFTLDIQDAVMRYSMDENCDKRDVFSNALSVILKGTGIVFVLLFFVSLIKLPGVENRYLIFLGLTYFLTAMQNSVSLFCRGIDKVDVMAFSGILSAITNLILNVVFLVVFRWGLLGYLAANTIGLAVGVLCGFLGAGLYKYVKVHASKNVLKDMCCFSYPLIFSVIAWWINNASDRYILTWISGVAASGVYAIAYKIPNVLIIFQNIFSQAWSISAIKEFDAEDKDGFIGNMYTMMNFAMVIVCSVIMLLNVPIAKMLYAKEFFEAWRFVPPLLIAVVFNAMALFIGSIFTAVKDTKTLAISTVTGAVVNTAGNFLFIHLWGAYGAALATLIGYAVTLIIRKQIVKKHIAMKVNGKRDFLVYCILLLQMIIALAGLKYIIVQSVLFISIVLLYYKEWKQLFRKIKAKKH